MRRRLAGAYLTMNPQALAAALQRMLLGVAAAEAFPHGLASIADSVGRTTTFDSEKGGSFPVTAVPQGMDGRPAVYGVRPEHFRLTSEGLPAEVVVVEPTGSETQVFAKLGGEQVVAVFRERHQFNPGDKVKLKPDPSLVHLFDETTGKRL